jgi:hypothetical protein
MPTKPPTTAERLSTLENALGLRPRLSKPVWYKNLSIVISIFGLALGVIGLGIAYFAWWQPQWKEDSSKKLVQQVDSEIEKKLTEHKFDQVASDVSTLKGQMTEISGFVRLLAQKEMQESAHFSRERFQENLPTLTQTPKAAKLSQASTAPAVITGLQAKLLQSNRNRPEFWSAASALIAYRSPQQPKSLPDCLLNAPDRRLTVDGNQIPPGGVPVRAHLAPQSYRDCKIDLSASYPYGHIFDTPLECTRCDVSYRGGNIGAFEAGVVRIQFIDCTFEVHAEADSPLTGRQLIATLLSSANQGNVSYAATRG